MLVVRSSSPSSSCNRRCVYHLPLLVEFGLKLALGCSSAAVGMRPAWASCAEQFCTLAAALQGRVGVLLESSGGLGHHMMAILSARSQCSISYHRPCFSLPRSMSHRRAPCAGLALMSWCCFGRRRAHGWFDMPLPAPFHYAVHRHSIVLGMPQSMRLAGASMAAYRSHSAAGDAKVVSRRGSLLGRWTDRCATPCVSCVAGRPLCI